MSLLTAYVAGVVTPVAAFLGCWAGLMWWRRLRRAQGLTDPMPPHVVYPPEMPASPAPPSQDGVTVARVAFNRARPGRTNVRRSKPGR